MDRILKLVYNDWIDKDPLPNGIPPILVSYLKQEENRTRTSTLMDSSMFAFRGHNNFRLYYKKHFPNNEDVDKKGVINDDAIYLFPIEIRTDLASLTKQNKFNLDSIEYSYSIIDTIDPEILSFVNEGKIKLLINYIHDPINDISDIENIEKYFKEHNVNLESIIIISGNSFKSYTGSIKIFRGSLFEHEAAEKMMAYPHMSVLGYMSDNVKSSDLDSNLLRTKKFLSFNRQMNYKPHRQVLAYFALKYKMLDQGFFSFIGTINLEDLSQQLKGLCPEASLENDILSLIPYEIDTQHLSQDRKTSFSTNNNRKDLYLSSYMHITTETGFSSNDVFFSEKTFRPIINLQPFITFANYGCLKELQEIGFKTFHPYIDESYDLEYDSIKRIKLLELEIKRFAEMPLEELHQIYYSMVDILIHNQEHLKTFKDINPYERAIEEIQNLYR
jgi:hypothetical protein